MTDNRPSWGEYFMHLAEESSFRSRDPHTKVGACIVKDKRVLSLGYNGAPRAFDDNLVPETNGHENMLDNKNTFMVHAELNAILNFRGNLGDLEDSTLFVTVSPCYECAKLIAQVGIKNVIYKTRYHTGTEISDYILTKCGVKFQDFESYLNN